MKQFDVEDLLDTARRRTGLNDFGPEDFREAMTAWINALNAQGEICDERWGLLHERIQRLLSNRLWMAKDMAEHPEIANEDVGAPAIIISLPRTGSTKLHRMLGAAENDFQTLKLWQVHMPSRIPGLPDGGRERRIQETRDYEKWMYETSPDIISGHPIFTDEPEECQLLNEFSFRGGYLAGAYNVPLYDQWMFSADMNPAYDYYLSQLKYLQWQARLPRTKQWLLKSPHHLGSERYLSRIFRKPRVIVTHRDPAMSVASIANPVRTTRKLYSDTPPSEQFGDALIQLFGFFATEHLKWRDANPEIPILDLSFDEINADGAEVARKVYDFLGMPLSPESAAAMRAWEENNGRDKHGKNRYSAEAIGKTDERIRAAFAPYIARYARYL